MKGRKGKKKVEGTSRGGNGEEISRFKKVKKMEEELNEANETDIKAKGVIGKTRGQGKKQKQNPEHETNIKMAKDEKRKLNKKKRKK